MDDSFFQGMIAHYRVTYVLGQCVTHVLGSYPPLSGPISQSVIFEI